MTLISVVVPVYNGERDLAGCLASVSAAVAALAPADRANVELIVCDNHSTDRSLEIAQSVQPGCELRIVQPQRHEPNRTLNWAHGLNVARGEWMQMLHADDQMSEGGLTAQLSAVRSAAARSATLVSGRHRTFERDGDRGDLRPRWPFAALLHGPRLAHSVLPLHCTLVPFTLMRRGAYDLAGGLDPRWQLVQDWELWMRLAQAGDVLVLGSELGRWRLHPTSPAYRSQNAEEQVALADALTTVVPGIRPATAERARLAARARAALLLDGVEHSVVASDLPDAASARRRLRGNSLVVTARLYALRAGGTRRARSR